jgi:hypothetical protein
VRRVWVRTAKLIVLDAAKNRPNILRNWTVMLLGMPQQLVKVVRLNTVPVTLKIWGGLAGEVASDADADTEEIQA